MHYPDTDDTALVLMALRCTDLDSSTAQAAGLAWLLGMQNRDGGWAAFDRENHTHLVEEIPFCDFGEVLDPSSADVTAHILEALGRLGYDLHELTSAGAWLISGASRSRMAHGLAGGASTTCTVRGSPDGVGGAGTGCAQRACGTSGRLADLPPERRWWLGRVMPLLHRSCLAGARPQHGFATAWALLGLLAVASQQESDTAATARTRGVQWLIEHQAADGTWDEPHFTGTGFPGDFYIKYHEYRNYFPLLALSRTLNALGKESHA